jgi:hypothetical protein
MATGQHDPGFDPDQLGAELHGSLDAIHPADEIGRELCRRLMDFIDTEVLPSAMRMAEQGIDPTPILDTVAGILRAFADSLARPDLDSD